MRTLLFLSILLTVFTPRIVYGEYCATGSFEADVCRGFIIKACRLVKIDAVKGDDGKPYTINRCYRNVTDYSEGQKRCWIKTKSDNWGILSWGINAMSQPVFLHKGSSGAYEEVGAEYITFRCQKL